MLDKTALQQHKKRWQAVARFEEDEERQSTSLDRWQRLNAIVRLAGNLNLAKDAKQDETIVWNRWNRLRELHLGNSH